MIDKNPIEMIVSATDCGFIEIFLDYEFGHNYAVTLNVDEALKLINELNLAINILWNKNDQPY